MPRFRRRRGVVVLRVLAPMADGGSESFGETSLRRRWHGAGLPRPRTQIPVEVDGVVYRLDMGLEEDRFAAEYDGAAWHSSTEQRLHDTDRRTLLAGRDGWTVEVFGQENVYGLTQDADRRLAAAYSALRAPEAAHLLKDCAASAPWWVKDCAASAVR